MIKTIPYKGFGDITFEMSFEEVKGLLRERHIQFNTECWANKGCDPEVAWDIIQIGKSISIFFAKNRMFKIYFENDFEGVLENGISLGMNIKDAEKLDPTIQYDDWEEIYTSEHGYWLEDDVESGEIISITIFIKELEDADVFFRYDWCNSPV